jgi:hypothetical protein
LAHFIKGGIFLWLGMLMIARWAGSFADLGWAWNAKPPTAGRAPSMELVESSLICFYGVSNVWLEHLSAWGEEWSAMDFEHVGITILFAGAGLVSRRSLRIFFPFCFERSGRKSCELLQCRRSVTAFPLAGLIERAAWLLASAYLKPELR